MIPSSTFRTERDARTTDGDAIGAAATQAPFAIFFCVFDSDALACGSKRSLAGGFWDLALNQAPGHFSFQHSENLPEHPTQRRVPEPYNCTTNLFFTILQSLHEVFSSGFLQAVDSLSTTMRLIASHRGPFCSVPTKKS